MSVLKKLSLKEKKDLKEKVIDVALAFKIDKKIAVDRKSQK